MNAYHKIGKRLLFCLLASIGFLLLYELGMILGRLAGGGGFLAPDGSQLLNPNAWLAAIALFPTPYTLAVFLLFAAFKGTAGMIVLALGRFFGAFASEWIGTWPVDYSNGYPVNYSGGYINGGMVALLSAAASIVLAVIIHVIARKLLTREGVKENTA